MLKLALLGVLLSTTAVCADGPAAARRAPPPPTCKVEGPVVFAIDHRVDPNAAAGTSLIELHGNGSYTFEVRGTGGKPGDKGTGCLSKDNNDRVTAALKAAPWTITTKRITCKAHSVSFVVYSAGGKEVYTQKVCGADTLDAKSQAAIDAILPLIDRAP